MATRVLDITGPIREGMWNYEPPFPEFRMAPLPPVPWAGGPVFCETFSGLHSQTGTYLETPAHFYGAERAPLVDDLDLATLVDRPAFVLHVERTDRVFRSGVGREKVSAADLERAAAVGGRPIPSGAALLVSTGWGRYWMDERYLPDSPYFTADAMDWLLACRPFLLGSDFPRWENLDSPQGFFPVFFASGCLMLAPCVGLERSFDPAPRLTVLPLRIPGTSCVPCRAILVEEEPA
jgi:kynurenine formamidase